MKRIPRRIFREEFKREAIKLVNVQGLSIAEASKKRYCQQILTHVDEARTKW